jgi:hypothetical protein
MKVRMEPEKELVSIWHSYLTHQTMRESRGELACRLSGNLSGPWSRSIHSSYITNWLKRRGIREEPGTWDEADHEMYECIICKSYRSL